MRTLIALSIVLASTAALAADFTVTVDNSIATDLVPLCDRLRLNNQYSSVGWTNTKCAQAIFNAGLRVLADREVSNEANQYGREQRATRYDQLIGDVMTGIDITEPAVAFCGDSNTDTEFGEECDDGNNTDGDGCQANCRNPICGDGIVDPGETCDDGNGFNNDGCSATYTTE